MKSQITYRLPPNQPDECEDARERKEIICEARCRSHQYTHSHISASFILYLYLIYIMIVCTSMYILFFGIAYSIALPT